MRLKKTYLYLLSFISLSILFSACYYLSYQHALNEFNRRAIERHMEEYAALDEQPEPTPSEETYASDTVSVGTQAADTIQPTTKYVLEIVDLKTGAKEVETLNPPGFLVGLTKEEVNDYLTEYMSDLTLSEYNKGLKSYELVSFSDKEVVIRKSYNEDLVPYRFYVVVKDGYVVVYNSDLKSVYNYTHIEAKNLSEDDRIELSQGIYVDSLDELYALLESYSS